MTYLEIHERLLYATASAQGALAAGARDHARELVVTALVDCGVPVTPFVGEDLESTPAVLVITAATVEDSICVSVIPSAELGDELREALSRCDHAEITHDAEPALREALSLVTGETVWPFSAHDRAGAVIGDRLRRPIERVYFVFEWT